MELLWNLPQTSPDRGTLPQTTRTTPQPLQNVEGWWKPCRWWNPGATLVEPLWNCCGTFLKPARTVEPYLKPGPPRSPCRMWWDPGGNLADGGTLVQPCWNPGGTLVESWWNPGGTLAKGRPEPIWAETPKLSAVGELFHQPEIRWLGGYSPQRKVSSGDIPNSMWCSFWCSHHYAALAEPRGTLVFWWNPCGTLVEPYLRATPEPIWTETPKLSAVWEKTFGVRSCEVVIIHPDKIGPLNVAKVQKLRE